MKQSGNEMSGSRQCPQCEYNLQGTSPDDDIWTKCPECGKSWTENDLQRELLARRRRCKDRRWAVVVALPALISLAVTYWHFLRDPSADLSQSYEAVFLWTLPIPLAVGLMWAMRKSGLGSRFFHCVCYALLIVLGNYLLFIILLIPLFLIDMATGRG